MHGFGSGYADWQAQFEQLRRRIQTLAGIPAGHYRPPAGKPKPFGLGELGTAPHFHDPEDKLGRLRATLTGHGRAAVIASRATLHGMGGIGKTQLALNYCYAFRHAYDGIWWFSAEIDTQVQINAEACATALGLPAVEGELPALTLRRGLEHEAGHWLLVYDNAESPEAVRRYLPACGAHHVLVTSHDAE